MFFEAEHDLFPRRKKRSRTNDPSSPEAHRQRRESLHGPTELPEFCLPSELYSPPPESLDCFAHLPQPMTYGGPTIETVHVHENPGLAADSERTCISSRLTQATGLPKVLSSATSSAAKYSFATVIADSHFERVKFFKKFAYLEATSTPIKPMSRGKLSFDGGPSLASSPTQSPTSVESFGSSLVPVTIQSSNVSSDSFTTQASQSNNSFVTASSTTTVSIDDLNHACPDCDLKFCTPDQKKPVPSK